MKIRSHRRSKFIYQEILFTFWMIIFQDEYQRIYSSTQAIFSSKQCSQTSFNIAYLKSLEALMSSCPPTEIQDYTQEVDELHSLLLSSIPPDVCPIDKLMSVDDQKVFPSVTSSSVVPNGSKKHSSATSSTNLERPNAPITSLNAAPHSLGVPVVLSRAAVDFLESLPDFTYLMRPTSELGKHSARP